MTSAGVTGRLVDDLTADAGVLTLLAAAFTQSG